MKGGHWHEVPQEGLPVGEVKRVSNQDGLPHAKNTAKGFEYSLPYTLQYRCSYCHFTDEGLGHKMVKQLNCDKAKI